MDTVSRRWIQLVVAVAWIWIFVTETKAQECSVSTGPPQLVRQEEGKHIEFQEWRLVPKWSTCAGRCQSLMSIDPSNLDNTTTACECCLATIAHSMGTTTYYVWINRETNQTIFQHNVTGYFYQISSCECIDENTCSRKLRSAQVHAQNNCTRINLMANSKCQTKVCKEDATLMLKPGTEQKYWDIIRHDLRFGIAQLKYDVSPDDVMEASYTWPADKLWFKDVSYKDECEERSGGTRNIPNNLAFVMMTSILLGLLCVIKVS